MRLFTGDECGLLKECIPELSRKPSDRNAPVAPNGAMPHVSLDGFCRVDPKETQSRSRGLIDMIFVEDKQSSESPFATLRQNGSVEMWEGSAASLKKYGTYEKVYATHSVFDYNSSNTSQSLSRQMRLKPLALGAFQRRSRLVAGDNIGNLSILDLKNGKVIERYNAYATSKRGSTLSYTPGKMLNTQLATGMAFDPVQERIAVGGRERETTLIDLVTGKVVFKAKNLPPDPQTLLQQPVWPTSILFMKDSNVMAVGTGYKEVRLYDVRENTKVRRPTATTPEGLLEYRVTCMCQTKDYEVVVGDTAGNILGLDLRTLGRNPKRAPNKNMGRYVGPAGSVRQLKKHPSLPRLAAVGLDRMLRIYDTENRKQLDCIYLKQRLNCVLFGPDETISSPWDVQNEGDDDLGIDQDDVVQDYVDSDEENQVIIEKNGNDSDGASIDEDSSSQIASEGESSDCSDEASVEQEDDENSIHENSSQDYDSDTYGDGVVEQTSSTDDDEESEDEEIVIHAPLKRRRKR